MRKSEFYKIHIIANIPVLIYEQDGIIEYSRICELNESAYRLYSLLPDTTEFSVDDIAAILKEEYSLDQADALKDAEDVAREWVKASILLP